MHLAPALDLANAVLDQPTVGVALNKRGGTNLKHSIGMYLDNIAASYTKSPAPTVGVGKFIARVRKLAKKAIMPFNVMMGLRQGMSVTTAKTIFGFKIWAEGLVMAQEDYNGTGNPDLAARMERQLMANPLWKRRLELGSFSASAGQLMSDYEMKYQLTGQHSMFFTLNKWNRAGDKFHFKAVQYMSFLQAQKELGEGASEADVDARAVEIADRANQDSAPMWNPHDTALLYTSPDELTKMMGEWRSFHMTLLNKSSDIVNTAAQNKTVKGYAAATGQLMWLWGAAYTASRLATAAFNTMLPTGADKERKKRAKEQGKPPVDPLFEALNAADFLMRGLPGVSQIAGGIIGQVNYRRARGTNMFESTVQETSELGAALTNAIAKMFAEKPERPLTVREQKAFERSWAKAAKDIAKRLTRVGGMFSGQPLANLHNLYDRAKTAIPDTLADEMPIEFENEVREQLGMDPRNAKDPVAPAVDTSLSPEMIEYLRSLEREP